MIIKRGEGQIKINIKIARNDGGKEIDEL